MAELTGARIEETAASPCCSTAAQTECCEPSDKADCCMPESSSCGCAAGISEADEVRAARRG